MKVFRRIGVSVLVVFLTIGLCYSEAWGLFDKEKAKGHVTFGRNFLKNGQWDKAIAAFNKAIELDPKCVEAYITRGNAYNDKGQHDKAISDYTKVIEINPRFGPAYSNRGLAWYKKGDYDRACSDYQKACKLGACEGLNWVKKKGYCQ